MKNKLTLFIFLTAFILLNVNILYGITKTQDNLKKYFRIHIVANSDNIKDQMLKLKICDAVNTYINQLTINTNTKSEYVKILQDNIHNILNVANKTQTENGYYYPLTIQLGNIQYDTKTYNEIEMPSGTYNSLRIIIGSGIGNNWWSLLYPSSPQSNSIIEAHLNEEIQFKSIILELFRELF